MNVRITLSPRIKRLLTLLHVVSAMVWLTYVLFVALLALHAKLSSNTSTAAGVYEVLYYFNTLGGVGTGAISVLTLLTGVALSVCTPWGLVKYWWILLKLAITGSVIVFGLFVLRTSIRYLATTSGESSPHATQALDSLLWGSTGVFALLLCAATVSYLKPWGTVRTPSAPVDRGVGNRIPVRVRRKYGLTSTIQSLELVGLDRRLLPRFTPGAHIAVHLPSGRTRHYSLCSSPRDRTYYRIAVLRDEGGRGGSQEVHHLPEGSELTIDPPRNAFPLRLHPKYVFVAGGIGITPLLTMVEQVDELGLDWELVYTARQPTSLAYAHELYGRWPGRVSLYCTSAGPRPNLIELLSRQPSRTGIYSCGPAALLHNLRDFATTLRPDLELHTEQFNGSTTNRERHEFNIQTDKQNTIINVPAQSTALDALNETGVAIESSCGTGICGTCKVPVIEGDPLHPDGIDGPSENRAFYPCVSRADGTIVLDV
ncbi:PDR/VanB family oxidoreductase [Haloglycomyces albus]|uniref:PDR/VanB family oxidoreductase n=1 Tax=Haloglycomyces albus TaxID=526067 RepID=UPI00046C9B2C|nr:PDR/VanB family oxidoreductase [Haloglycomyces albus]